MEMRAAEDAVAPASSRALRQPVGSIFAPDPPQPARVARVAPARTGKLRSPTLLVPGLLAAGALVAVLGVGFWALRGHQARRATSSESGATAPISTSPVAAPQAAGPAPDGSRLPAIAPDVNAPTVQGAPQVVDTATLSFAGQDVRLSGIIGRTGQPAVEMHRFLAEQGREVACRPVSDGGYACHTRQGYDVAAAALINGAARASPNAPAQYQDLEAQARAQRKGIWR
jgi:endonuclease YncB( thermonuclease family)